MLFSSIDLRKLLVAFSAFHILAAAQSVGVVTDVSTNPEGVVETSVDVATFLPTTFSGFETLSSTIHTAIGMATSTSMYSYDIGPGGVGWTLPSASGGAPPLPQPPLPLNAESSLGALPPASSSDDSSVSVLAGESDSPNASQPTDISSSTTDPLLPVVASESPTLQTQPTQESFTPPIGEPSDTQVVSSAPTQDSITSPVLIPLDTQSSTAQSTQDSSILPVIIPSDSQSSVIQPTQDSTTAPVVVPSNTQSSQIQPTQESTTAPVLMPSDTQTLDSQPTVESTTQQSQESASQDSTSQDSTTQDSSTVPPVIIPPVTQPSVTKSPDPMGTSSSDASSKSTDDSSKTSDESSKKLGDSSTPPVVVPPVTQPSVTEQPNPTGSSASDDSKKTSDDTSKTSEDSSKSDGSSTPPESTPSITEPPLTKPSVPTEVSASDDCTASAVSDCIVSCAKSTSNSCASYTTTCTQTSTGCDVQGMTTTVSSSVCNITPASALEQATQTGCNGDCLPGSSIGTAIPPFTTSGPNIDDLLDVRRKRAIAGRIDIGVLQKRDDPKPIPSLGGCPLNAPKDKPLKYPNWPNFKAQMLRPDVKGQMAEKLSVISRYDRATTAGCIFTTTRLSATDFKKPPPWTNYVKDEINGNNDEGSLEHAYEKQWLKTFINSIISSTKAPGALNLLSCDEANQYFFPTISGCQDNVLQSVFNELGSKSNLRFLTVSNYLNSAAKGSFFPDDNTGLKEAFVDDPKFKIPSDYDGWSWPSNPPNGGLSAKDSLQTMIIYFETTLYGALEMKTDNMLDLIQETNLAIYKALQNLDSDITQNKGNRYQNTDAYKQSFPSGFASVYKDYMTNKIQPQITKPPQYLTNLIENAIYPMIVAAEGLPDVDKDQNGNDHGQYYPEWDKIRNLIVSHRNAYKVNGAYTWEDPTSKFEFNWDTTTKVKRDDADDGPVDTNFDGTNDANYAACPLPAPPPPPETTRSSSVEAPKPTPAYAPGNCTFHLTEYQNCNADTVNLFADITLKDNNGIQIGSTSPLVAGSGTEINAIAPLDLESKLPFKLEVTGEHKGDYIQFSYNGQDWKSNGPSEGATGPGCKSGGWDPKKGPSCLLDSKSTAKRQMDCWFHC